PFCNLSSDSTTLRAALSSPDRPRLQSNFDSPSLPLLLLLQGGGIRALRFPPPKILAYSLNFSPRRQRMGKQKGDGGRSKNRPSSSSLAASLLPSGSSAAAVGFGGYVGSSRFDVPVSVDDSAPFLDVDSEVAQHLKRLARKDPVTKLKALQALSALFKVKSGKDIALIIPQWAFEYKRLLLDYNREVRRATHETMTNLVVTVGRDIAPHLKSLMGPWWFSQFDPVSEVSLAAKRSLQAAFPAQEKRLDAFILCTTEIFLYLEENLKLTPQSLSDKAVALDELEDMYHQAIASTLLALATLIDVLFSLQSETAGLENVAAEPRNASKARATATSFAEKLFSGHKYFLDFLKSQNSAVRTAAYSTLKSFIKSVPHVFNDQNMRTVAVAVFGAFQEKDPACYSSIWDTVLLFSKRFPESWTMINVQKNFLARFWNFLRHQCFGSQQVSYPSLILFLESVPSNVAAGERFFLDFFQNLWDGRSPLRSAVADRSAFFKAFRECFLFASQNAPRYCNGVDSILKFRITLVEDVLVQLLWHDYLFSGGSNDQDTGSSVKKTTGPVNLKYPSSYLQELGKCITEILSGSYLTEYDVLSTYSVVFREDCVNMFQKTVNVSERAECVDRIIKFLLLLEQHSVQKGEDWPLVQLVGPMLANSFPLIKSFDVPDGIKLLSVAVSTFGPRRTLCQLFICSNGSPCTANPSERDKETELVHFMQVFSETFVPWCLSEHSSSIGTRLDLLLELLNDENFPKQWDVVVSYVINQASGSGKIEPGTLESERFVSLAMLLDKARVEMTRKIVTKTSVHQHWYNPEAWFHELLDSAAVLVAYSPLTFKHSASQFLCAILGGSSNDDQIFFVSKNIIISIVKMFSKRLLSFVAKSSFESVRDSGSVLNAETDCAEIGNESSVNTVEMAQSSLGVLRNSFFCLKPISEDNGLVSGVLASIFIIKWEFEMMKMEEHATNDESNEKMIGRREVCQVAHDLCLKENDALCKSLPANIRMKLGNLLVQSIRLVILKELKLSASMLTSLCCSWMGELLASLCLDETEEQTLLDQLLSKDQNWPSWIVSDFTGGSSSSTFNMENDVHVSCNVKLVTLIDKLIKRVGINKVLHLDDDGNVSLKEPLKEETTTRAWLAAEILCTWNWIDGAAVDSFLPSLVVSAKAGNHPCVHNLLDGILDILLNGALVQGERGRVRLLNVWPASNDELGKIEEPFLRALLTLVVTLLNDGIWGRGKATELFELLITKLYIGESVNTNCLRILPSVINVLIQSLCRRVSTASESTKDNQLDLLEQKLQDILKDWLHRTLMFPPLVEWTSGQDMEEWVELVIACYPLSLTPCSKSLKLERDISLEEKTLVLDLFRKQKHRTTSVVNQLPVVRILLSELLVISVGYCWKQFAEDDWEFFFSQIRSSIQSVVVIMEESAESVNDVVSDGSTSETSDVLKKLDQLSSISDASAVNVASNALASFSLFCGALGLKSVNDDSNSIVLERWNSTVDRLQEAILRLFFCTGISEAISSTYSDEAASVVAKSRCSNPLFWQLVASNVINSSPQARERAVKSVEFWGLSTGSISSLYAILFSLIPIPALQHAAYVVLSTEPVSQLAVVNDSNRVMDDVTGDDEGSSSIELSSEKNVNLAEELSLRIEKPTYDVLEINLLAHERVNLFLSWSLLLSHLGSLPTPSPAREQLVQYVQGSGNSVILDCIFQHIPLEECSSQILKKKDAALPPDASEAARAASRAITTGSLLFAVESLWPIGPKNMATLAGALYGFMLRVLPAYVRGWFSELRDRSISSLIESFTRTWCSPALIVKELSQIKKADFADEIFSVSVSKSANEVVATYTKEETGMDLVIRLPASYPLRHVDVDCMRSLGISEVKQRKWLMSMTMFVRNQNGALAEAIRTWKSNLDKEFQGVEECPICYSVIHTDNRSLPRLACRTCKHKFHSACLYKWFSTSHKSSCPLCQSPF
ncbi:E3 ubiquitin-protein ligase listerin, partial [Linum perenne]